jgi:hypothetical protein
LTEARTNWLELVGRLRAGQGREQAADALNRDFQQRASELPPQASVRLLILVPGDKGSSPVRGERRSALMVLFALTGLALALACANVACLAAVRTAGREKEMAIRLAIGAGRSTATYAAKLARCSTGRSCRPAPPIRCRCTFVRQAIPERS